MPTRNEGASPPWHRLSAGENSRAIATDPRNGLSELEASKRFSINGPNELPEGRAEKPRFRYF